jgi:hypothetical protein
MKTPAYVAILSLAMGACMVQPTGTAELLFGQLVEELPLPPPPEFVISAVPITIASVEAHKTGGGWFEVLSGPIEVDLVEVSQLAELFDTTLLPIGHYTQVRLTISSASATIDGVDVALAVPSGKLKLVGEKFEIVDGGGIELTIDFDPGASVVIDEDGFHHLKPVVKYDVQ